MATAVILALPYALAVAAVAWINPEGRLYPHYALRALGRGMEGEWAFPWLHAHTLAIFSISILVADALGWFARVREWDLRLLTGYVFTGLLMFVLGLAGLYQAAVFWGFAALVILARWSIYFFFKRRSIPSEPTPRAVWWPWLIYGLLLIPLILYALTPPIQSDGIRYHLAALQEYLKAGSLIYLPHNAFSNLPFLVEMIFLLPLGLGSDSAAQLVHVSFLVLAAEAAIRLVREIGGSGEARLSPPAVAFLVRLSFLSIPVAVIVSAWPFVDLALLAFFLAMLLMLFRWLLEPDQWRNLNWCGLFAGACLATKYTMVVFTGLIILIALAVSWRQFSGPSRSVAAKSLVYFLAIIALVSAPWYVKNLVNTGNPVYPLANGIFRGGEWGEASATLYGNKAGAKGSKTVLGFVAGPILTTMSWTPAPGKPWPAWMARLNYEDQHPGLLFLMLFPVAAAVAIYYVVKRRWARRRLPWWRDPFVLLNLFGVVYYVFWFFTYQSNRFMLPLYAMLIVSVVVTLVYFFERRMTRIYVMVLIAASFMYGYSWGLQWMFARTRVAPLPYLLGYQSREDYIAEALPHTKGFHALEAMAEPGGKTLFIGEYRGYYCRVPYIANDFFDQPVVLDYMRRANLDMEGIRQELRNDGIQYIYLNWAELQLYINDFRRFFSPDEWRAFENLLNAPWLEKIWEAPPGFIIYEITSD